MKIIKPSAIAAVSGLLMTSTVAIFYVPQEYFTLLDLFLILGLVLFLGGVFVMFITLPMEYQKKGISDVIDTQTIGSGRSTFAKHSISQSPRPGL